jgi:hypothetical protein
MSQSFGAGYYPPPQPPRVAENHPKAVPALVLGILSLVCCGLFTGIPAIVMGRRAAADIRYHPQSYSGLGLARAGFWTGLIGTAWSVVSTVIVIGVFVSGGFVQGSSHSTCHTTSPQHPHRQHAC